jgi:hypothetical protein
MNAPRPRLHLERLGDRTLPAALNGFPSPALAALFDHPLTGQETAILVKDAALFVHDVRAAEAAYNRMQAAGLSAPGFDFTGRLLPDAIFQADPGQPPFAPDLGAIAHNATAILDRLAGVSPADLPDQFQDQMDFLRRLDPRDVTFIRTLLVANDDDSVARVDPRVSDANQPADPASPRGAEMEISADGLAPRIDNHAAGRTSEDDVFDEDPTANALVMPAPADAPNFSLLTAQDLHANPPKGDLTPLADAQQVYVATLTSAAPPSTQHADAADAVFSRGLHAVGLDSQSASSAASDFNRPAEATPDHAPVVPGLTEGLIAAVDASMAPIDATATSEETASSIHPALDALFAAGAYFLYRRWTSVEAEVEKTAAPIIP